LRVEIRTVNGRGYSCKLRLPPAASGYEAALDELLRAQIGRGSVTLVIERVAVAQALPETEALRGIADGLVAFARSAGLPAPTLADVLHVAAATGRAEAITSRPLPPRCLALVQQALADLAAHRRTDGQATAAAVLECLADLEAKAAIARLRAPLLVDEHRERLRQRVDEFVARHVAVPPPAGELVREVALFADRVDVAEELQRLGAHIVEVKATLARGGEVGRRLEFLLQELLRESNTLGSKSPDVTMAHAVVAMKTCIDRMKEQAANLE
jgi:uncharacterized protein (TIGR00255 family)